MGRSQVINYRGRNILEGDFSYIRYPYDFISVLQEAVEDLKQYPEEVTLALFIVTGVKFNTDLFNAMNTLPAGPEPVKVVAVVGVSGFVGFILRLITGSKNNRIRFFRERTKALDWLLNFES